jgi:hypothetical protein
LLQVKVVPLRSVVGPDLSLPSDPDWSLALVGVGVLATVVEGTARCLMRWVALPRRTLVEPVPVPPSLLVWRTRAAALCRTRVTPTGTSWGWWSDQRMVGDGRHW